MTPETTKAKRQALKEARTLGVDIEFDCVGIHEEIRGEAPAGYVFIASGTHGIVAAQYRGLHAYEGLWESILIDLNAGIEPCDNDDCEVCHPDA